MAGAQLEDAVLRGAYGHLVDANLTDLESDSSASFSGVLLNCAQMSSELFDHITGDSALEPGSGPSCVPEARSEAVTRAVPAAGEPGPSDW